MTYLLIGLILWGLGVLLEGLPVAPFLRYTGAGVTVVVAFLIIIGVLPRT